MDRPLTAEVRPTKPPSALAHPPRPQPAIENPVLISRLRLQSEAILRSPYDPSGWIARSATLTTLGFPELAVGDAHKATRLCEAMLSFLDTRSRESWSLGSGNGFWMRDETTSDGNGQQQDASGLIGSLNTWRHHAQQLQDSNLCYRQYGEGRFVPQDYPWLEAKHRVRNQKVLNDISSDIVANIQAKSPVESPYIRVKRCTFRPGEEDKSEKSSLGIFAARNVQEGHTILVDRTEFFGCNGPGPNNCKSNLQGGAGCLHPPHPNIEADEGEHDLRWIRERTGKFAADSLLLCRVLLACVRENVDSPFDLPALARLTAAYHRQKAKTFWLERDIVVINDALQQFGIDIFANRNYDTWVLFTIMARLNNNSWTNPTVVSLNPIFSLFNHSCEPNVEWESMKDHRKVAMRVSRDVVAGEQLFVEYDSYIHDEPVDERRRRLTKWIDGSCMCSRCVREDQALRSTDSGNRQIVNGHATDVSGRPFG